MIHFSDTRGSRNPQSKLKEAQVRAIKERLQAGETCRSIARDYPRVTTAAIESIQAGKTWKHV